MSCERLAEIKLPAQYGRLVTLINQIQRPASPGVIAAKVEELVDLRAAILSSPDYNAWRQGISPEAYQNPTLYGGTDPRDPLADYVRLPRTTPQDSWIPRAGGLYDRMAADGKVYIFRPNSPAYRDSGYAALLGMIEGKVRQLTGRPLPDARDWEGEKLGAGLPLNANPPVIPFDLSKPGTEVHIFRQQEPSPVATPGMTGRMFMPESPNRGTMPDRLAAARAGTRIHQYVDEAYRALESPNQRIYLPNGAYLKANRTVGGKMRPDLLYVDDVKKEFYVFDIYTGSKKDVFTPTGFDSKSHSQKGLSYVDEPDLKDLLSRGYRYRGYYIAQRPASLPPNKLH